WARRPDSLPAVAPYLAMSLLYKKSNRFWHWLIRRGWVHRAWTPLVQITRLRHLAFRRRLATSPGREPIMTPSRTRPGVPFSAGV
ncbi:MAG: hypothetical protein IT580_03325, partial [Verrucomicrobiales bacterium]|nr:hypothetical protein [Verrucomicrobiales bacterium]